MLKKFVTMSQVFITTHLGQERFGCVIVAKSFNLLQGVKVLSDFNFSIVLCRSKYTTLWKFSTLELEGFLRKLGNDK